MKTSKNGNLNGLTQEQKKKIIEYRDRYFNQATSCAPADRTRAESAARRMAEIAGVKVEKVKWVNNPFEADSLSNLISDSIWYSLRDSIWDLLRDSIWDSLSDSLSESLRDSLWDSLRDSLWDSLCNSFRYSLRDSLSESLRDSLWDTGWLCFYTYAVYNLGIEISEECSEKLRLHNEIAASCFAVWIVPGAIILCERPESVEIKNGKLKNINWRKE